VILARANNGRRGASGIKTPIGPKTFLKIQFFRRSARTSLSLIRLGQIMDAAQKVGIRCQPGAMGVVPQVVFESDSDSSPAAIATASSLIAHCRFLPDSRRIGGKITNHDSGMKEIRLGAGYIPEQEIKIVRGDEQPFSSRYLA